MTAPFLLGAAVVVGGLAALSYGPSMQARDRFAVAKASVEAGRDALLNGDARSAARAFASAEVAFIQARAQARNPALRAIGWLPILGRTPDAVAALAEGGRLTAEAGVEVANALNALSGGVQALAPHGGRFDAAPLVGLADAAQSASERVASALDLLDSTSSSGLLEPVSAARTEAIGQLTSLERALRSGSELLRALPAFLGSDSPQRYFFGAVSPSELRGSGGFLGAYAILTVDRGRMQFSPFRTILALPHYRPDAVHPPSADYARNYDRFGGAGFWQNINMTPDFPSAAVAIERLYEKGTTDTLDGVVLADPFVLQTLLDATGPVQVPSLGRMLSAENVVVFTTNQAYSEYENQDERKTALGWAAAAAFEAFMRGQGSPFTGAHALARTVSEGHLSVYSNDPRMQHALVDAGAAGAFAAPTGDFLSLVQNNAGANKVDYYLSRSISYSIQLGAEGTGLATAQVQLRNDAPLTGASSYVLGPYEDISDRGEHVSYTSLYCASTCRLQDAEFDGKTEPQQVGTEGEFTMLQDYIHVASGTTASLEYRLGVRRAWFGDATGGMYRLTFLNQATIRPTQLSINVQLPAGMVFSSSNMPMQVSGSNVSWQGEPGRRLEIEIRFHRPWLQRTMQEITDFLTKPIFRIR
jgi:Protein of unknown function (DUF4012)